MRAAGCFPAEAEVGKGKLRKEGKSGRARAGISAERTRQIKGKRTKGETLGKYD